MFSSNTSQVSNDAVFVEDVFSTWLYTGNGSTRTINNGIDLAGKGGLVWVKSRDVASGHFLYDTSRGVNQYLASNTTAASANYNSSLTAFNSNGFTLGFNLGNVDEKYASWTFRKQPKFFDVVTYTGNGAANRYVNHSLASVPGCIILKRTDAASDWAVWHRVNGGSTTCTEFSLNQTGTPAPGFTATHTSTQFALDEVRNINNDFTNVNGATYVACLFAHNAGGFGLTGTDNVISCGSYTGTGSAFDVSLGYEPQWILVRGSSFADNWYVYDNIRGMPVSGNAERLFPNLSNAAVSATGLQPNATGFTVPSAAHNSSGATYIYIAIRRGPMKTPTSGTSVFTPQATRDATDGTASQLAWTAGFPVDMIWTGARDSGGQNDGDRLRGGTQNLILTTTDAEGSGSSRKFDSNLGIYLSGAASASSTQCGWMFQRAPGFFDEVCYTGTAVQQNITHNLGVAPELLIVKRRSGTGTDWAVYAQPLGASYDLQLNSTGAATTGSQGYWASTTPTASVFTVRGSGGGVNDVNSSGGTYVAYLFASCPGVSKVGSYTGTGATQTISCGFAARFVLIKRTDSTGNWWVWDTSRGMVSGTDPRLALNSTAGEINTNWVYTNASGFQIVTTDATVNANGGSYIYLAIA